MRQQTKERQHLVVSLSPQSDGWTEGPTVKDMLDSGFEWVRRQGGEWREELSRLRGKLNLQGDPENIPITKELMERVNSIRQEEGKKPLELPVERWNFNMKYALMDNGKFKVGWGQNVESARRNFVDGKSIVFFWRGRQIVGLYGCAKLGRKNFFVADDGFKGNIRAPVEFCVKFNKPLTMNFRVGMIAYRYISDNEARELIERAIKEGCAPEEKLREVAKAIWGGHEEGRNEHEPESKVLRYFAAKGFHFTPEQVAAFYAALKTKGFVILSGLSGTGKTKLAQLFAELLCPCEKCQKEEEHNVAECGKCTHLFLPVRPDWRDSKALLGYYNPLTERYESTPLLEFLLRAAKDYQQNKGNAQPYFVILDEMNLAHVEYYFADFLSVLESGRDEKGECWTEEALRLHSFRKDIPDQDGHPVPPELHLPPNLYIVGTVNIDETTYMFSPKVLDRSFTLEFREVQLERYAQSVKVTQTASLDEQWIDQIALWLPESADDHLRKEAVKFFEAAIRHLPEQVAKEVWFGVHNDRISLTIGNIWLASLYRRGRKHEIWLLVDRQWDLDARSTQKYVPLGWRITALENLPDLNADSSVWEAYKQAAEKVLHAPIARTVISKNLLRKQKLQTGQSLTLDPSQLAEKMRQDLQGDGTFCAVTKERVTEALGQLKEEHLKALNNLCQILQPYDLHFGYRVLDEIALFVQNAKNAPDVVGNLGDDEALDYAVLMKVLPKFHGPRQKLEKPLREVLKWAAKDNAPEWAKDTSKPIGLEQVTESLRKWEQFDASQQQARQEAGQGADRQDRQPDNAQQGQDNQTATTHDQATQGKSKDQSGTSTTQPFKAHFRYPNTAKKVLQMLRQLYETGFASFAQ